jgi:hypothetical protein
MGMENVIMELIERIQHLEQECNRLKECIEEHNVTEKQEFELPIIPKLAKGGVIETGTPISMIFPSVESECIGGKHQQFRKFEEPVYCEEIKKEKPDCYSANDDPCPLCIGNQDTINKCIHCHLYINPQEPYNDGPIKTTDEYVVPLSKCSPCESCVESNKPVYLADRCNDCKSGSNYLKRDPANRTLGEYEK